MKKMFVLLLILLLCGCSAVKEQPETTAPAETTTPPETTAPTELFSDPVDLSEDVFPLPDVSHQTAWEQQANWGNFLYGLSQSIECDGRVITRTGDTYTLTEDGETTEYAYLIRSIEDGLPGAAYNTAEYILLTNDETMTGTKYMQAILSSGYSAENEAILASTALVYSDAFTLERTEAIGDCPYSEEELELLSRGIFRETSFFVFDRSSADAPVRLRRYDYNFNLLCTAENADGTPTEYADGFLCAGEALTRYDSGGSVLWSVEFPASYYHCDLTVHHGEIYTAGTVKVGGFDRIYLCRFSPDGELLRQRTLESNDFDWPECFTDGLTLLGRTQSTTGDVAVSTDGYFEGFSVRLDENLELHDLQKADARFAMSVVGWHNGARVWYDELPVNGIFDLEDRYITVTSNMLAYCHIAPPSFSRAFYYEETVITCYVPDGSILWRVSLGVRAM